MSDKLQWTSSPLQLFPSHSGCLSTSSFLVNSPPLIHSFFLPLPKWILSFISFILCPFLSSHSFYHFSCFFPLTILQLVVESYLVKDYFATCFSPPLLVFWSLHAVQLLFERLLTINYLQLYFLSTPNCIIVYFVIINVEIIILLMNKLIWYHINLGNNDTEYKKNLFELKFQPLYWIS